MRLNVDKVHFVIFRTGALQDCFLGITREIHWAFITKEEIMSGVDRFVLLSITDHEPEQQQLT